MMPNRHLQRGAGALAAILLLLCGTSIAVLYLNRGLLFEQRTSANQLRSTTAFEIAEAGIEWATGMLNTPHGISTACAPSSGQVSFRRRYVQANIPASADIAAAGNDFPGCKFAGTTLTCSCPDLVASGAEAVAAFDTSIAPSFTVAFANVPGDVEAVRVTSTGCTALADSCKPATALSGSTTLNADATATVSVVLKLRPLLRSAPQAALSCGTACSVGGSSMVVNDDVAANGYLVNAGTTISTASGVQYQTLPGLPVPSALVAADSSLLGLSSAGPTCFESEMFKAYFGSTLGDYANAPVTKTILGCNDASACGSALFNAYNEGWRSFYLPDGLSLDGVAPLSVLGSPDDAVALITPAGASIGGGIRIYGLVFAHGARVGDLDIHGAVLTCAAYQGHGSGMLKYDRQAIDSARRATTTLARVPGSWLDLE